VPFARISLALCVASFFMLVPRTRRSPVGLNLAALMAFFAVYLETAPAR
jgi:hypothetical protein